MEDLKVKVAFEKKEVESSPNLRGFASVSLGDITIHGVAIYNAKEGQDISFSTPILVKNDEDKTKDIYVANIYNTDVNNAIKNAVKEAMGKEPEEGKERTYAETKVEGIYDRNNIKPFVYPKENEKFKSLRANVTLKVSDFLELNNFTYVERMNDKGESFTIVNPPRREYKDPETGESKFADRVYLTDSFKKKVKDAVDKEYESALQKIEAKAKEAEVQEEPESKEDEWEEEM